MLNMMKTLRIKPAIAAGTLLVAVSAGLVACSDVQGSETTTSSIQSPPREAEAPTKEVVGDVLAAVLEPTTSPTDKQANVVGDPSGRDESVALLSETISAKSLAPIETSVVGMMIENDAGTRWSANVMFLSQNPGFPPRGTPITVRLGQTQSGWGVELDSIRSMQQRFEQIAA
ncbi:hypothetical protein AB4Z09_27020 [Rhodococcus sp. TAF43]|uniref:hypothetical protein n=1 Tax=Rhodococcus sp. TAF43 TaxID=3237483 RepID=UPI003F9A4C52